MKIGAVAACFAQATEPHQLLNLAIKMDEAGMDALWFGEHVLLFDEMEFGYPGSADGKLPVPAGQGAPDQTAIIGFLASQTRQLRFGTSISLIPQRNPVYTAKEFATLDWLSAGRVELGVGVGWCKEEVESCGYAWENRGKRCDEALELMIKLWTHDTVSHQGEHFSVSGGRMDPKPQQKPHIPLIVGGYGAAALRRTAQYGQGWWGFGLDLKATAHLLSLLDNALDAAGRKREELDIMMMPIDDSIESVKAYADLGVNRLTPMVDTAKDPSERLEHLQLLQQTFG